MKKQNYEQMFKEMDDNLKNKFKLQRRFMYMMSIIIFLALLISPFLRCRCK
jgi:hypothetical protein